jgi:septum formation protein
MPLVLASASPRRAQLLRDAGIPHRVAPVDVDESILPGETPADHVRRLASLKASAGAQAHPGDLVLGADTVVVLDGDILGKPRDANDAQRMLRALSGRAHEVYTGVAIAGGGRVVSAVELATVWMGALTPEDIDGYVASGEPSDKAGAYAVQGLASRYVERVDGAPSTVIGLPVATVCRLLRAFPGAAALLDYAGASPQAPAGPPAGPAAPADRQ